MKWVIAGNRGIVVSGARGVRADGVARADRGERCS